MGRKKIEIRPLTDERNRNVTFLKRKAGLMKKAWELSVLCGAEVSILIFNAAGKPYEFSSRELDGEIDRYLEYEGLIERRRGEEFAAMAEAGEDDDDEDEDGEAPPGRKNSKAGAAGAAAAAAAGANGQPKPVKSLKGKESFKKRMYSRRDMARSAHKRKRAGGDRDGKQGFIDGILSSSDDEGMGSGGSSDGLAYALNMHNHPAFASLPYPASLPSGGIPSSSMRGNPMKSEYGYSTSSSYPPMSSSAPAAAQLSGMGLGSGSGLGAGGLHSGMNIGSQFMLGGQVTNGLGSMSTLPPNMGGIQWDASLAQRYAEFQLQQNHQRQQRVLLDRQRAQLAELGVNMDGAERRLLDDVFGARGSGAGSGSGGGQGSGHHHHQQQPPHINGNGSAQQQQQQAHHTPASHGGMSIDSNGPPPGATSSSGAAGEGEFIWPTFGNASSSANASASASAGDAAAGAGAGADADGRGYYTTPESYEHHHHPHQQSHSQWTAQQQAQMGYSGNDEMASSGMGQQQSQSQSQSQSYTSPLSYDEERRRREEMYVHAQAQGQGQGQVPGQMGLGAHHEKRIRVN